MDKIKDINRLYMIAYFYNVSRATAETFYYNINDIKYYKREKKEEFKKEEWEDVIKWKYMIFYH